MESTPSAKSAPSSSSLQNGTVPGTSERLPPRFVLGGQVLNVYQKPSGVSRDGQAYGGSFVAQLLSADHLRNGETKLEPTELDLGSEVRDADTWRALVGQRVSVPVTVGTFQNRLLIRLSGNPQRLSNAG